MTCDTCNKFNLRAFYVGLKDTIKRDGVRDGIILRSRGLNKDIPSATVECRNPNDAVQKYGLIIGLNKRGQVRLMPEGEQLGRGISVSSSVARNVQMIQLGEIDGDYRTAMEQGKHFRAFERFSIETKDGESFITFISRGKTIEDGFEIVWGRRVGNIIEYTSRLLPQGLDSDKAIKLLKEIAPDTDINFFGKDNNQGNALYMGLRNIDVDLKSKDFEGKLNKVIRGNVTEARSEKKIDVRILSVVKDREILTPLILTRTVPVSDFKVQSLRDFVVVAQGKSEESKVVETKREPKVSKAVKETRHYQIEQEGQRRETAEEFLQDFRVVAQGKTEQVAGNIVDEVTNKHEEEVLVKTEKVQPVQAERVRVEVRPKIGMRISIAGEELVNILESSHVLYQSREEESEGNFSFKEQVVLGQNSIKVKGVESVVLDELDVIQKTVTQIVEVQEEKEETGEECEKHVVRVEVEGDDVVEEIAENVLVNRGEVVDYGKNEVALEVTEGKPEIMVESGTSERIVIFDARKIVLKKPEFFGEILIPQIILKKPNVFKIPRANYGNIIFSNEIWMEETGAKMQLDLDTSGSNYFDPFVVFVPGILWWIEDFLLPDTRVRV